MALKKVKGSIDRIFDKNLQDLVRGIRNHKDDEAHFISTCIDEIKVELKQDNVAAKANATKKLIYLQMLGYDISWAAFNVIEVMSSAKFTHKRIGYMVASQSFHSDTDVLMLATNLIKKDLTSQNVFDVGVALSGLSCFITPDLARDLSNDLLSLMSSTKPYIRKRAVLISYKIFLNYPEALRPAFPRLREKLEDPDPGVQSAAVNVICELARKNPKNYLSLAPVFFKLMTSSTTTNNWVLIKVIKLFGALTPLEPRLGKKLIEPLTNLIHNTSAMSLLYECINTVIQGMQDHSSSIQGFPTMMKLCVQKLRILIEDTDQNLKYLGLLALSRILKSHPKAVQAHKDLILQCLDDKDESIRLRALDLLFGMVSKKNLMEIIQKLLAHVQKAETIQYRDELISKIIEICSRNNFFFITNFEWYLTVLIELTRVDGASRHGSLVSSQILDVAIRVKTIRPFAASKVAVILRNSHTLSTVLRRNGMIEVLYAAAYICGEFGENIDNLEAVLFSMLDPHVLHHPTHIQHIFLQNVTKLLSALLTKLELDEKRDEMMQLTKTFQEKLAIFLHSSNLEVQERASTSSALLKQAEKMLTKSQPVASQIASLFKGELNPVGPKAQKRVPLPEGLDLDAWINDPPSSSSSSESEDDTLGGNSPFYPDAPTKRSSRPELSEEELRKLKQQRKAEQASNPNYLSSKAEVENSGYQKPDMEAAEETTSQSSEVDAIPLHIPGLSSSDQYMKLEQQRRRLAKSTMEKQKKSVKGKKSKKKSSKKQQEVVEEVELYSAHKVEIVDFEMPEGALKSDSEDENKNDIYKALDIDLNDAQPQKEIVEKKSKKKKTKPQTVVDVEVRPSSGKKKPSTKKSSKKSSKNKSNKTSTPSEELAVSNGLGSGEHLDKVPKEAPEVKIEENMADLSITEDSPANRITNGSKENGDKKEKKSKKSKSKKGEKKEKKKKKKPKPEPLMEEEMENEEIMTSSTNYQLLVENKNLRVEYETQSNGNDSRGISLICLFSNLTDQQLNDVRFNMTDTLNTTLVGGASEPFSLVPYQKHQMSFQLTATSVVMPQRLRGDVTIQDCDPLNFKLYLPCSSYLVTTSCSSDSFAKLLSGDTLTEKSSVRLMSSDFSAVLQLISKLHFTVVEQIGENASLYSKSIQQHQLCLLIKKMTNGISVEGKGTNQSILSNVIDEIKSQVAAVQQL